MSDPNFIKFALPALQNIENTAWTMFGILITVAAIKHFMKEQNIVMKAIISLVSIAALVLVLRR